MAIWSVGEVWVEAEEQQAGAERPQRGRVGEPLELLADLAAGAAEAQQHRGHRGEQDPEQHEERDQPRQGQDAVQGGIDLDGAADAEVADGAGIRHRPR
jgi:hypothetical protein